MSEQPKVIVVPGDNSNQPAASLPAPIFYTVRSGSKLFVSE
jgi:hypothetical protein